MADLDEVDDEKLEAHLRARITPEIVEWAKRKYESVKNLDLLEAQTDAAFGSIIGTQKTLQDIYEDLERLLTESQDPEFR